MLHTRRHSQRFGLPPESTISLARKNEANSCAGVCLEVTKTRNFGLPNGGCHWLRDKRIKCSGPMI